MIRKNIKKFSVVILFILVCVSQGFAEYEGITDEERNRIAKSQSAIDRIAAERKRIQNTINNIKKLKNDTQTYIEELDKNLELLTDELNNTLFQIDVKQVDIDNTNIVLENTKEKEKKQYEDMKLRIKFFYEKGDTSILESILAGNNLEDILTKAEYIQNINDYDMIENQLEQEKAELVLLKETEIAQKENIEALIEEKTKELEDINSKINTSNAELKKLQEEQKKQEAEILAIERAILARGNSNRILSGGLIWPCPSSKKITSGFGKRKSPTKGASSNHQGIDISAPTGTTVISAAAGEVVISTYSYSAGNYIMINHGSGIFTIYMHLSKKIADVGQEVSQGQKIGEVGSTGYATGPHLHFGIRKNGSYVNPLTFVG